MRRRKYHLPVLMVLAAAVLGCNLSKYVNTNTSNAVSPSPSPTVSETPTPTPKSTPSSIGDTLRRSPGKYPYELKLMENKDLQARLKKIMGDDYTALKSHFDV